MSFKNEIYNCLEYKPYVEGESVLVRRDELQDFLNLQVLFIPHELKYLYENSEN